MQRPDLSHDTKKLVNNRRDCKAHTVVGVCVESINAR